MVFTDAYVSGAVCSPSRAGLFTGRYQQRFGHENNLPANSRYGLPLEEKLIGDRLKPLGYTSGLIGKWHLGYKAARLDRLQALGLEKNTLVIFANDNGGQTLTGAVNTPLQGHKGELFEGGIRVPMAMRWPGVIRPGTTNATPVIALDWLPTFLDGTSRRKLTWRNYGNP